jgi:Leucine-rich repeat (LRR) protein
VLLLVAVALVIVLRHGGTPAGPSNQVVAGPGEGPPTGQANPPKERPAGPDGPGPVPGDPAVDRRAAVWVLNQKGQVGVTPKGGNYFNTNAVGCLPAGDFILYVIHFENNQNVTNDGLRELEGLANLEELNLPNTRISDAGLVHLEGLKRLKRLNLSGTRVTDAGLNRLRAALPGCQITAKGIDSGPAPAGPQTRDRQAAEWALRLGGKVGIFDKNGGSFLRLGPVDGREDLLLPGGRTISVVRKLSALPPEEFRLDIIDLIDNKQVTDADVQTVAGLPNLRSLLLNGTAVTDLAIDVLKGLPALEEIDLSRTGVTLAGAERLKTALPRCLVGTGAPGEVPFAPGPTSEGKPVRWCLDNLSGQTGNNSKGEILHLDKPKPTVSDAHLVQLRRLKSVAHLRDLDLNGTRVTDAGLANLKGLNLRKLHLASTRITDAGLEHLKGLPDLEWVDLTHTPVTGTGLEYLQDMPHLQRINLKNARLTDAGLEHARALTRLHRLQLDLSGTPITDAGLKHLEGLTNLHFLDLSGTQVTDAGLKHLKDLPELDALAITNTVITGAGLDPQGLASLRFLFLNETQVADADLEHFKGFRKLEYLGLKKTRVTAAGAEQLRKLLPKCNIEP